MSTIGGLGLANQDEKFYLIHRDILPEAIAKTIEAKTLLDTGEAKTVHEAVERVGISRSAFYKYRDKIFPFNAATYKKIITVSLLLEHQPGVLSRVLKFVADQGGNILTINQSIPLQGVANVVLSVDTIHLNQSVEEFLDSLQATAGVKRAIVVGEG